MFLYNQSVFWDLFMQHLAFSTKKEKGREGGTEGVGKKGKGEGTKKHQKHKV